MNDLWLSMISGGAAGALIVGVLSKFIYMDQNNKKHSKYDIARRHAVEEIYKALVATSVSRVGFEKFPKLDRPQSDDEFVSLTFDAFTASFESFDHAFKSISSGYAVLEKNAIYIEQELEDKIMAAIKTMHTFYIEQYAFFNDAYNDSKDLSSEGSLNQSSSPFDFNLFYDYSINKWLSESFEVKNDLKKYVRDTFFSQKK